MKTYVCQRWERNPKKNKKPTTLVKFLGVHWRFLLQVKGNLLHLVPLNENELRCLPCLIFEVMYTLLSVLFITMFRVTHKAVSFVWEP